VTDVRFKGLDLNLLVALDILLEERSVSRAAERMNISQPAMSGALARLRDYFRDPILVSEGKRMFPSAYAESLVPQLRASLRGLDALVSSTSFDPMTSRRTFKIIASDFIIVTLLARVIAELAEAAPAVQFDLIATDTDSTQILAEGKVDLLVMPDSMNHPDHPTQLLFEERHVVVGWNRNPLFERELTEADFLSSGHVVVAFGRGRLASFADQQLARDGKQRRVEVISGSFGNVPWLLIGTPRLALMHEQMAIAAARHFPISFAPVPFDFPLMRETMQYHAARETDDGLRWLRDRLAAGASAIHNYRL